MLIISAGLGNAAFRRDYFVMDWTAGHIRLGGVQIYPQLERGECGGGKRRRVEGEGLHFRFGYLFVVSLHKCREP